MISNNLTPNKRVMMALRGERPDKTPFTVYENKIPQSAVERELRNRGTCIVYRQTSFKTTHPNVSITEKHFTDERGRKVFYRTYSTPVGDLTELIEPTENTVWFREYIFKSPDDYKALLYLVKDTVYVPDYDNAVLKKEMLGEDFLVRDQLPAEPLQYFIAQVMGPENFCYEWMDNRDIIIELYNAQVEADRKGYEIVANGPLEIANLGGNVVATLIGVDTYENYYMPRYAEAGEIMHKKGKLIGCHMDADNTLIMDQIGSTDLDYIEAYDVGMGPSLQAARKAFKDKVIWLNWPSAWHLNPADVVKRRTIELIEANAGNPRFIIGITEDVPPERWQTNFLAITQAIDESKK